MATLSDDDITLAAEATLGLLDPAQQAAAAARIATDLDFAAEVDAWHGRLLPLIDGPGIAPPASVWTAVHSHIFGGRPQEVTRQDNQIRHWKRLTALSTGIAAVLALILIARPAEMERVGALPPLVAALGGPNQPPSIAASFDRNTSKLTLMPVVVDTGEKYPELWVIPVGGKPLSLGLLRADAPSRMILSQNVRVLLVQGATLAITAELEAGAPHAAPAGPIVASGTITSL